MRGLGISAGLRRRRGAAGASLIAVPAPRTLIRESVTDFTVGGGWALTALTVNDNPVANYSGSGFADQTRSDATTGLHGLQRSASAVAIGVQYYADFVVKPDGRNHMLIQIAGPGHNAYAMVGLVGNTVGDTAGVDSVTVQDLSNGWKFVRMIFTAAASAPHSCNLFHATGTNVATDYGAVVGDITKGLLLDRFVLSRNP